jgi:hypothetical protein
MIRDAQPDRPDEDDIIIWHVEDSVTDVYRITKGAAVLGEFTGRSIGSTVFHEAAKHVEPGRAVWLKDDLSVRRLNPPESTGPNDPVGLLPY